MNLAHYEQLILFSFVEEMIGALEKLLRGDAGSPSLGMEREVYRTECAPVSRVLVLSAGFADMSIVSSNLGSNQYSFPHLHLTLLFLLPEEKDPFRSFYL